MIVLGYNGALLGYPERTGTGHDSSAAIVVDGELVAACEEERFNREKHSAKFPKQAMAFCLKQAGLESIEEVDLVAFYWSCGLMFRQDMLTQNRAGMNVLEKLGTWGVLRTMQAFNKFTGYNDDHIKKILERNMGVTMGDGKRRAVPHHLCHVASTFYDSPHEEALCVTLDGSGESSSSLVCVAKGTDIETLQDEYKIMGLAPYGNRAVYREFFRSLVRLHDDGRYEVDQGLMVRLLATLSKQGVAIFPPTLIAGLGPPRKEGEPVEQRHMDIAASLQECLEETVLQPLERLQKQTGQDNLCMAGGVALNSTMNGRIARSGLCSRTSGCIPRPMTREPAWARRSTATTTRWVNRGTSRHCATATWVRRGRMLTWTPPS
jgi:carbamoyltransferase